MRANPHQIAAGVAIGVGLALVTLFGFWSLFIVLFRGM